MNLYFRDVQSLEIHTYVRVCLTALVYTEESISLVTLLCLLLTSQNTMYCGGEPEASYTKRHIAYIF